MRKIGVLENLICSMGQDCKICEEPIPTEGETKPAWTLVWQFITLSAYITQTNMFCDVDHAQVGLQTVYVKMAMDNRLTKMHMMHFSFFYYSSHLRLHAESVCLAAVVFKFYQNPTVSYTSPRTCAPPDPFMMVARDMLPSFNWSAFFPICLHFRLQCITPCIESGSAAILGKQPKLWCLNS